MKYQQKIICGCEMDGFQSSVDHRECPVHRGENKRTNPQNRSIHLGCQQIADILIENNITLNMLIRHIEVRPTKESVKEVFKSIARAKYVVDSTTELSSSQVDPVWEDLIKAVSEATGIFINFPSQTESDSYINSLEQE